MKIEVWSDVVCPWCYIGKRNLENALEQFDGEVEVVWRAFELDPGMPREIDKPLDEILSKKYGISIQRARDMQERVESIAEQSGVCMNFDSAKTGNTFDAHRLIKFAQANDLGEPMKERLMSAYFVEGIAIADHAALATLASEVGLDRHEAEQMLESGAFGKEVREEEADALELGIRGVPFFLIDRSVAISGAQGADAILSALKNI